MPGYNVTQRYTSRRDGQWFGPWEPDTEVDLSEQDAEWVNRDSPGTLAAVDPPGPEPEPEPAEPAEPEPERAQPPARDRQQRRTANRRT